MIWCLKHALQLNQGVQLEQQGNSDYQVQGADFEFRISDFRA